MVGQFFTSNASNAKVILGFYQVRLRKNSQLAVSVLYLLEGDMIQTLMNIIMRFYVAFLKS